MDKKTAEKLTLLRAERKSYGDIATELGLSINTVKSYCYRHDLGDDRIAGPKPSRLETKKEKTQIPLVGYCKECGTLFKQNKHGSRLFCSKLCLGRYHRKHNRNAVVKTCPVCGKTYKQQGYTVERKYCSQECYVTARYYMEDGKRITKYVCKNCGKMIIVHGHSTVRKYCSQECYFASLRN